MYDIIFEITKPEVGTRAFLVDSYATGQEINPFYGTGERIFMFREALSSDINSPRTILTTCCHVP